MTSRAGRIKTVVVHDNPKLLEQIQKESQKLSKIQDIRVLEEKRRAVEKDLDQAQDMAADILRRADEDAAAMRHAATLECEELHTQAKQAIGEAKAEVEKLRQSLTADQELLSVEKEDLRLAQLSHAEAVRHLVREEELLHGKYEEAQRNAIRYQASAEALQADLAQLAVRERKISDMEARTIQGLKTVEDREAAFAGKEDSLNRLKEDAARELREANQRSHEAQEKWSRADRREEECARREKALEEKERVFQAEEQRLAQQKHIMTQRENECLLREARAGVRANV